MSSSMEKLQPLLGVWSRQSDVDVLITFGNHFTSLDGLLTTRSLVYVSYLHRLKHMYFTSPLATSLRQTLHGLIEMFFKLSCFTFKM